MDDTGIAISLGLDTSSRSEGLFISSLHGRARRGYNKTMFKKIFFSQPSSLNLIPLFVDVFLRLPLTPPATTMEEALNLIIISHEHY